MPQLKSSFARLSHADPSQLEAFANRLRRVNFELGEGHRVLAVDRQPPQLTVQLVARRLRDVRHFDEANGKFVSERAPVDRELYFSVDLQSRILATPGGRRDFGVLVELLRKTGGGSDLEAQPLIIDLVSWVKALLKMYENAQLGQLVVDSLFVEPRMIGRYTAKSVDNRLDLGYIEKAAGQLRSLRLGFFHEGSRRSVEARSDATLSITSSEEEDAEHFFAEQRQLLLQHELEGGSVDNAIL
jgi:hypothetical protein